MASSLDEEASKVGENDSSISDLVNLPKQVIQKQPIMKIKSFHTAPLS